MIRLHVNKTTSILKRPAGVLQFYIDRYPTGLAIISTEDIVDYF